MRNGAEGVAVWIRATRTEIGPAPVATLVRRGSEMLLAASGPSSDRHSVKDLPMQIAQPVGLLLVVLLHLIREESMMRSPPIKKEVVSRSDALEPSLYPVSAGLRCRVSFDNRASESQASLMR